MGLVRWLWRHKRSVAVVSVAAAGAYTAYRLWRRGRSLEELLLEQLLGAAAADGGGGAAAATRRSEERLHEHFRVTQRECDALLERHVAALRAQVQSQLDPKPVRARMRAEGSEADGSGGWRELKVLGFARAVGSVYVLALLAIPVCIRRTVPRTFASLNDAYWELTAQLDKVSASDGRVSRSLQLLRRRGG